MERSCRVTFVKLSLLIAATARPPRLRYEQACMVSFSSMLEFCFSAWLWYTQLGGLKTLFKKKKRVQNISSLSSLVDIDLAMLPVRLRILEPPGTVQTRADVSLHLSGGGPCWFSILRRTPPILHEGLFHCFDDLPGIQRKDRGRQDLGVYVYRPSRVCKERKLALEMV